VFLLEWLEYLVSWVLVQFHALFTKLGFPSNSGFAWGMAIVCLVVVIRIGLIPLFVKQIKAQRGMQTIQPQMKAIQKKYAGDRERQSQEMMKLYKETGTNPLASCLPIVLQAPIFFALFRVLNGVAHHKAIGAMTAGLVVSANHATIFGAPLSATFKSAPDTQAKVVIVLMILAMTATTFITQRQLMVKNMTADNPMAQQQKILLYVFPLMFAVFGINFPVGVLIYWLTTNLWSMGQQFYVIRRMPAPGSAAEKEFNARQAEKSAGGGGLMSRLPFLSGPSASNMTPLAVDGPEDDETPPPPKRNQPRNQPKAKRKQAPSAPGKGDSVAKKDTNASAASSSASDDADESSGEDGSAAASA